MDIKHSTLTQLGQRIAQYDSSALNKNEDIEIITGKPEEDMLDKGQITINRKQIEKAVDEANHMLKMTRTSVRFKYHEKSGEYSIKIIDDSSNKVIKEIPPDQFLDMIAKLRKTASLVIDKKI